MVIEPVLAVLSKEQTVKTICLLRFALDETNRKNPLIAESIQRNMNQNARKSKSKIKRKAKASKSPSNGPTDVKDKTHLNSTGQEISTTGTVMFGPSRVRAICINFLTVIVSTLGLILAVLGYCVLGGSVFEWLEANTEKELKVTDRLHVAALIKQHAASLYTNLQLDASNQSLDTVSTIAVILKNVSNDAFKIADDTSWDGERVGQTVVLDWTLSGAILFSVTTITTIGELDQGVLLG